MATRFVSSTKESILEFQNASRNVNTDKSNKQWMTLFMKFREVYGYSNDIVELDNKTLSDQLEKFLVEVRKSNGQEYKASSLYVGFCAIAQEISEIFENIKVINLFDASQFKSLHRTLDGRMKSIADQRNNNRKQSDPLEIDEIKFLLNSPATTTDTPKGFLRRVWISLVNLIVLFKRW